MAQKTQVQYINFYNPGTEAYQVDYAPVRKQEEVKLPKPRRQKKIVLKVDPVALLGLCVAVVMLICMTCGVIRLCGVWQQQAQMAEYVERLQQENQQLQKTYQEGYDLDEIYEIAIAMGMVPSQQAQRLPVQTVQSQTESQHSAVQEFFLFLTGLFA